MNREKFFGEAYVKWFRRTEAVLRRRGANPDLAQELAQAAWARGWERLAQLKDPHRLLKWVNTIAVNLLRDEIRRSRRFTELTPAVSDTRIPWAPDLGRVDLQRAVQKCQTRQRALLEAVYLHDRSSGEVASELGISVGSVHHRLSRARRSLRAVNVARHAS